ncbi:MAG: bifunctional diaminohydroxyphosphoribosylaminopyrimidine deaminase/5-amino-6-(5-phosphoribosylamino)uracil reductase RibD [Dehalococcoidia bacterium]|nr:bifunctional diaminohydroxyphosphoribosylaminopyrimidine deaminase/5-amino-6-(5-phosphoribosylamino)uracil reductase RibD [Dehalococcoidia bacterium]
MAQAIALAKLSIGATSPNPAVGAVIVKDKSVVGEGRTQPPGSWHAEMMALQQAGELARGATVYVSLEPCRHYGRTPPCTHALISAGIAEIHIATVDPNPLVAGAGIKELESAGIRVVQGDMEEQAKELIESHAKFITTGTPLVIAKFAVSLDGKIATHTGHSNWITGNEAREHLHTIRSQVDAIMVGVNTLIADNPQLTARPGSGYPVNQPLRVIVDSRARTPAAALALKQPPRTLIAVTESADHQAVAALKRAGVEVAVMPSQGGRVDLLALMHELGSRNITSLLVEGGGEIHGSLFDRGMVDKVMAYIAPVIIGGEDAVSAVAGRGVSSMDAAYRLSRVKVQRLGEDILVVGYVDHPAISRL